MSAMRKAIYAYDMIKDGDKIAVGVSGGKDSLVLLVALSEFQKYSEIKFDLLAINVDMNFVETDKNEVQVFTEYVADIGVELHFQKTDIANILFEIRKESNPCSLCSKMRRGALNELAVSLGCNKVALGHHLDDVIETFMLSLLYESRLSTFKPVSYLDRMDITLIRPFIYVGENMIIEASRDMPIIFNPCSADKNTKREDMKELIKSLDKSIPNAKSRMFGAITNADRASLWELPKKIK